MSTETKAVSSVGPWNRKGTWPDDIRDANGRIIAQTMRIGDYKDPAYLSPEEEANARLIAAAPEMLEALNRLMVHFFGQDEPACLACGANLGTGEGCDTCYVWIESSAAIRKAKGEL